MSNSAPPKVPFPSPPLDADIEVETITAKASKDIDKAAKEGRVSIRSGDLSTKVIEALAKKFGPKAIVDKISECLEATKTMAIGGLPYEIADHKTQLDALKLLLLYQVGAPVARSEVVTHNVDTMQSLEAKLHKSPALRRAVDRMLSKSQAQAGDPMKELIDISDDESQEAESILRSVPEHDETDIERLVRTKSNDPELQTRGKMSMEEKYTR
jgi:hypothetical protein